MFYDIIVFRILQATNQPLPYDVIKQYGRLYRNKKIFESASFCNFHPIFVSMSASQLVVFIHQVFEKHLIVLICTYCKAMMILLYYEVLPDSERETEDDISVLASD